MAQPSTAIPVALEVGKRRTFACAIDWPGWCRHGRDEASALQALISFGPRYAAAIGDGRHNLELPDSPSGLVVVERLSGNATTDFGAPGAILAADADAIHAEELEHHGALLRACWQAFGRAASAAQGKTLRKGPRGGGRDLEGIIQHVADANRAYLARLAWKAEPADGTEARLNQMTDENLRALAAAAVGDLPSSGPRGGKPWSPRYFVRRAAWHLLDHAWEIEDRAVE